MRVFIDTLRPGILAGLLAWIWVRLGLVKQQKYRDNGWESYAEKVQFKLLLLGFGLFSRKYAEQLKQLGNEIRSARIFSHYRGEFESNRPGPSSGEVSFKHSGNAGDLIYALPAMRALSRGRKAKLFLKLDAPINGWSAKEHPLGRSGLTAESVNYLMPLLEQQTWLSSVQIHKDEPVDYDLDIFRKVPNIRGERGSIPHWYFWLFGVSADLSQPWLEIRPPCADRNNIVLARSSRYRNPGIDYSFLRALGEIDFVGTQSEFQEMLRILPQLRHVECENFLQLARVIKSGRLFIGNQSLPYALAEALKVRRILEVYPPIPNVIPTGGQAGEAFFQANFEAQVKRFLEQSAGVVSSLGENCPPLEEERAAVNLQPQMI